MGSIFSNLNIRQRLTIQFLLLVSVLFLLFSISIYLFSRLYLNNRFLTRLQERAIITASLFIDLSANKNDIQGLVKGSSKQSLAEELVTIYDPQRKLFVFSTDYLKEDFHKELLSQADTTKTISNVVTPNVKASVLKIKDYWVIISAKDVLEKEALRDLRDILVILCLVALLFISYIAWFMADKALSPISKIGKQLEIIFPKNLSQRISYPNDQDEIGTLTIQINQLLNRVVNSMNAQKMFVANISHELKNPLTKVFTQIEILEMKYKNQPEFHEQLVSLREDTLKLNHLTQSLLQLASLYTNNSELPKKINRIDEVLMESITDFKRWSPEANVILDLDDFPENEEVLLYSLNKEAIQVVLKNLMDNACKFSTNNTVEIKLYALNGSTHISLFNNGTPISKEEISKIMEPFYRSNSTAKGKSGHGVGLAIVQEITLMHQIKMDVNASSEGNYFVLKFPTAI